ncbi:porin [Sorangium cellulosum]|nr:porin [Sorangium cellulosum]
MGGDSVRRAGASRLARVSSAAFGGVLVTASLAHAQSPAAGAAPGTAAAPAATGAIAAPPAATGAAAATTGAAAAEPATRGEAAILERLAAAERMAAEANERAAEANKRAAELEKRLSTVEDVQASPEQDASKDLLRIYGFIDVGVQRTWIKEKIISAIIPQANALNFVVGNLNLYLDAQPHEDFHFLGELRFTTAPAGTLVPVTPPPGITGRVATQPYGSADTTKLDRSMVYGGLVSIERAHIDWTRFNIFKVRVGQFFTPIGIYNVDHGSPVLITVDNPYFIMSSLFPARQTGVMAYGSMFAGPWELGYDAYVSNGRNEDAPFAFDDNRGFGGRLHASYEDPGKLTLKLGASFLTDRARNWVADTKPGTDEPDIHATWAFREYIAGGDASLDVGKTRLRAEAMVVRVLYDQGARQEVAPGIYEPDAWRTSAYVLGAHRMDFLNMEPFILGAMLYAPFGPTDTLLQIGGGLNFYITPDVTLRTQVRQAIFTSTREGVEAPRIDTTSMMARLILAF